MIAAADSESTRHDNEFSREPVVYAQAWLNELQWLAVRFTGYGITPDLAALTLCEAWGLFMFLRRVTAGVANV